MPDMTAGQHIAERYFLDDEEAIALAKDIDSALAKAISTENEACAEEADQSWEPGTTIARKIRDRNRNRRKT